MTGFIMNFEEALSKAIKKNQNTGIIKRALIYIISPMLNLPSVNAICGAFDIKKDKLYRMLGNFTPDQWIRVLRVFSYARLIEHKQYIQKLHPSNRSRNRITIAVDDSGFSKNAKRMPLIGLIWNGVLQSTCMGTQSLYFYADIGDGKARLPLDLRLCRGKGKRGRPTKSKIALTVAMMKALHKALIAAGCTTEDIVFAADSWFNADVIYETARQCGFSIVMKGKRTYVFEFQWGKTKASDLLKMDHKWRRSGQHDEMIYARYEAKHKTFGDVILTLYFEENGKLSYLISINPDHSSVKVILDYKRRWAVEVFFRDAKQILALGSFTFQKPSKIYGHFVLRTLSYHLLDMIRIKKFRRRKTIGQCARWLCYNVLLNIDPISDELGLRDFNSYLPEFKTNF